MTIAGTFPEQGVRVALDLQAVDTTSARYLGAVFSPWARHAVDLAVDVASGTATLHVGEVTPRDDGQAPPSTIDPPPSLPSTDLAFVRQVGKQLWRLATQTPKEQGGGSWPRRVQRWRGPK
jgi:hypothetical protein